MLRVPNPPAIAPVQPSRPNAGAWAVLAGNVFVAIWMWTTGPWLDRLPDPFSAVTLGGHHLVVLALAVTGFLVLAALAPITHGFRVITQPQTVLISVAYVMSLVAVAGLLSVLLVVVLAGLLGRLLLR